MQNIDDIRQVVEGMGKFFNKDGFVPVITKQLRKEAKENAKRLGISEEEYGKLMTDIGGMIRNEY